MNSSNVKTTNAIGYVLFAYEFMVLVLGSLTVSQYGPVCTIAAFLGFALYWFHREDKRRERGNKSQPTTPQERLVALGFYQNDVEVKTRNKK